MAIVLLFELFRGGDAVIRGFVNTRTALDVRRCHRPISHLAFPLDLGAGGWGVPGIRCQSRLKQVLHRLVGQGKVRLAIPSTPSGFLPGLMKSLDVRTFCHDLTRHDMVMNLVLFSLF